MRKRLYITSQVHLSVALVTSLSALRTSGRTSDSGEAGSLHADDMGRLCERYLRSLHVSVAEQQTRKELQQRSHDTLLSRANQANIFLTYLRIGTIVCAATSTKPALASRFSKRRGDRREVRLSNNASRPLPLFRSPKISPTRPPRRTSTSLHTVSNLNHRRPLLPIIAQTPILIAFIRASKVSLSFSLLELTTLTTTKASQDWGGP